LRREQYLDFLKCRRFRQTLLCRRDAPAQAQAQAGKVAGFLVAASIVCPPGGPDLRPGVNCAFETLKGAKCQTDLPAGKAALALLGAIWPAPLPFQELLRQISGRLEHQGLASESAVLSPEALCEFLLRLYGGGVVEFRRELPPMAQRASRRPLVHPLARWQARHGDYVTSLFHIPVKIEDEIGRGLLLLLDGTLDRPALVERLWELLKSKAPAGKEAVVRQEIETKLEENLDKLARLGLLAA
jgi:hypothetical protein